MLIDPKDKREIKEAYKQRADSWPTETIPLGMGNPVLINPTTEELEKPLQEPAQHSKLVNLGTNGLYVVDNKLEQPTPKGWLCGEPYRNGEYYAPPSPYEQLQREYEALQQLLIDHVNCQARPIEITLEKGSGLPLTLEQAVAVLNERKHCYRDIEPHHTLEWVIADENGEKLVWLVRYITEYKDITWSRDERTWHMLNEFEAIAVAEAYLRRA